MDESGKRGQPSQARLFLSFLKLGLTAFGGPVMVAYIRDLAVRKQRWLDERVFRDGIALVQSLPGATAMQMAAYVGLKTRGFSGALAAYLGFGLPAFVLMVALSVLYVKARDLGSIISLFTGLQVVVVAIVANAAWVFGRETLGKLRAALIAAAAFAGLWLEVNAFLVIATAAFVGVLMFSRDGRTGLQTCPTETVQARTNAPKSGAAPLAIWKPLLMVALFALGLGALFLLDAALFELGALMSGIGAVSFGGGFAALSIMHGQVVGSMGWLENQAFMDGIALGQVTPGPILTTATFVGYIRYGISGAVVATVGMFGASLLALLLAAPFFDRIRSSRLIQGAIHGILASFAALLVYITVKFAVAVPWDAVRIALGAAALTALLRKVDILWVVLAGAALSVVLFR